MKGEVYQRTDTHGYVLSLGFLQYCVLAIRLAPKEYMGEACWFHAFSFAPQIYLGMFWYQYVGWGCLQVYLQPEPEDSRFPIIVFNKSAGPDSVWRHVPTIVVAPACAASYAIQLKRLGPVREGLLKSALLKGVFLNRMQVEKCMAAQNVPWPEQGSGKGQRILKADLVDKLLGSVLGNSVSPQELAQVRKNLVKESTQSMEEEESENIDDGSCPLEILSLLTHMDQDNRDAFQHIVKQAADILEHRSKKARTREKKKAADAASAAAKADEAAAQAAPANVPPPPPEPVREPPADELPACPHAGSEAPRPRAGRKLTPDSLKRLLPPLGDDKVYLKWKSSSQQVQAEFIGNVATGFEAFSLGTCSLRSSALNPRSHPTCYNPKLFYSLQPKS